MILARLLIHSERTRVAPPSLLLSICAVNLQRFVNDPSNKQKDFQAGKQQRKMIFIQTRSQAAAAEAALISHPPYCWWAKSCAASSLAWLAQKADALWGKNEEFHHKRAWLLEQRVAPPHVLRSGLSRTLLRALLAESSPYGWKESKVLLTLQTWPPFWSHRGTLETSSHTVTLLDTCFFKAEDIN